MRRFLLGAGMLALAVGLLWIAQGTGTVAWPRSSFMINQLQWAGYGAAMAGFGLVLIWQGTS
jgi:hypothetical protein